MAGVSPEIGIGAQIVEQRDMLRDELIAKIAAPNLDKEYVAAGINSTIAMVLQALPPYADDLTKEFGDIVYDQMLRDPAVQSSMDALKDAIFEEPMRFESAIADEKQPNYQEALLYKQFIDYAVAATERPLEDILAEMIDGVGYGNAVAERTLVVDGTKDFGIRLILESLRPLDRKNYRFVVDDYGKTVGFIVRHPGVGLIYTTLPEPREIVERAKFMVFSYGVKGGDPRGRGILRAAYHAWWMKQRAWVSYLKYLDQFSTPLFIGFTPPDLNDDLITVRDPLSGQVSLNPDGSPMQITAEQAMLNAMLGVQSGSAGAFKGGSKIELVKSEGTGEAFIKILEALNREIALGILGTARATMESQHASRADSAVANDLVGSRAARLRRLMEFVVKRDLIDPLILANYGEAAVKLAPRPTLQADDREDFAKGGQTLAALWQAGFFHTSQVAGLDSKFGFPERDFEQWLAEFEDKADLEREAMTQANRVLPAPAAGKTEAA